MSETAIVWTRCAHPGCICDHQPGSKYCSEYCEEAGNGIEPTCGCGHAGCGAIGVLDAPGPLIPELA